jgi:hypothetical protein
MSVKSFKKDGVAVNRHRLDDEFISDDIGESWLKNRAHTFGADHRSSRKTEGHVDIDQIVGDVLDGLVDVITFHDFQESIDDIEWLL